MKKILFLFFLLSAVYGCRKNDFKPKPEQQPARFETASANVSPATIVVLNVDRLIEKDTVQVFFDSIPIQLVKLDSFQMGFLVPVVASGTYNLNLKAAGGQDSLPLTVVPYTTITDPQRYLEDLNNDLNSMLDSLELFAAANLITSSELSFVHQLHTRLEQHLSGLSTQQKTVLAYYLRSLWFSRSPIVKPTTDTAYVIKRSNAFVDPATQMETLLKALLPLHSGAELLADQNGTISEFWSKTASGLNAVQYLASLELYVLQKMRLHLLNRQIASFAAIAEGPLLNNEGTGTITQPLVTVRGRSLQQTILVTYRTIRPEDATLFGGTVAQLYSKNELQETLDAQIRSRWEHLREQFATVLSPVNTSYTLYNDPLPQTAQTKQAAVPVNALTVSYISHPQITITLSEVSGGVRLLFNTDNTKLPDGTAFQFELSYTQSALSNTVTLSEEAVLNQYPLVTIAGKVWMQENLATKFYRNGDAIPYVSWGPTWSTLQTPAWCYYNNDPASEAVYGLMYNWYAVNDPRGIAPDGWHIATDGEWTGLVNFLGGATVAGGKLKAVSPLWNSPNTDATNSSGFTALPGGVRGNGGSFFNLGVEGQWWTANAYGPNGAVFYSIRYNTAGTTRAGASKQDGLSVRCVKD